MIRDSKGRFLPGHGKAKRLEPSKGKMLFIEADDGMQEGLVKIQLGHGDNAEKFWLGESDLKLLYEKGVESLKEKKEISSWNCD